MARILAVAFLIVPIVELGIILEVEDVVGAPWTFAALIGLSLLGGWLVRREGRTAWRRFRDALDAARLPEKEVTDGALILVGGALLLTPGFGTDAFGLSCLLPPTRALISRALRSRVRRAFLGGTAGGGTDQRGRWRYRSFRRYPPDPGGRGEGGSGRADDAADSVEIVDVTPNQPRPGQTPSQDERKGEQDR